MNAIGIGNDRTYWVKVLKRIAIPMLEAGASGQLRELMPVQCHSGLEANRCRFTHLEAVGRTLAGIAPWLDCKDCVAEEEIMRQRFAQLSREIINNGVDVNSPDYFNVKDPSQPLVDAAFLAHGLLRAPHELCGKLDPAIRLKLLEMFVETRRIKPFFNNWLLFAAIIEAAIDRLGGEYDPMRVDYAIRQHLQWYKGDGVYGDGPLFRWDFYNSFVIQPMLFDVIEALGPKREEWFCYKELILTRLIRYAEVLERMISPEGTLPPIGRSLAYRFGALQALAQVALMKKLSIPEGQVRAGMTAVIHRFVDAPGTFDDAGWLRIGWCGDQPSIGEEYISTGSLYLCLVGLLPLGLSPKDSFWTVAGADWTSKQLYSGVDLIPNHGLSES